MGELDALDFHQSREVVVRFVDRFQHRNGRALQLTVAARQIRLQRGARADVRRIDLQRLAVRRHGARAVLQILLEHGAAPELQLGDGGHVGREVDLRFDRLRQLFPASELLVDPIERRQRRRLLGILFENREIELHSLVGLLDLVLVEAGQLEAD